jgi:hypothetical protein
MNPYEWRDDHPLSMGKSMVAVLGAWHWHHINEAQEPAIAETRCGQFLVLKRVLHKLIQIVDATTY